MSILDLRPDQQKVFAEDVLDIAKRKGMRFHGCSPWHLEIQPEGDMKLWFYGYRKGYPWRGGITIQKRADLNHAVLSGDSNSLVQAFEQIIDDVSARF
jgi:hypothetical protein